MERRPSRGDELDDRDLAATIACDHLEAASAEVTRVVRGSVNQVFEVRAGGRQMILRVHDADELCRFRKEAWCIAEAAAVGVPGPEVLGVGTRDGRAFILLSRLDGLDGDEVAASAKVGVWRRLGAHLRAIASIPVSGFGEALADLTDGNAGDWPRYVERNVAALNAGELESFLGKAEIESLYEPLGTIAVADVSLGLSHGDLSLDNTRVEGERVYVIDWGNAQGHVVPHYDLGAVIANRLDEASPEFAAFLAGYGFTRQDYLALRRQVHGLLLLEAVDKVRWACDRNPTRLRHHVERLRRLLTLASQA